MTHSDRVRAILTLPGWTQKRIGNELGVSQATISRWLGGGELKSTNDRRFADLERRLLSRNAPEVPAASEPSYDTDFLEEILTSAFKAIGIDGDDARLLSLGILNLAREGRRSERDPTKILNQLFIDVLTKRSPGARD